MIDPRVKNEFNNPWTLSTYIDTSVKEEDAPKNYGAPLPSFKWLCENLLDKLEGFSRNKISFDRRNITDAKVQVIDIFFKQWRTTVGPNIYPALVLILPHKDRSRVYNAKDRTVGRVLLDVLRIPKNSHEASHIMKWKQQRGSKGQKMSTVCVETIKKRQTDIKGGTLSITDVNQMLDRLAKFDSKREDLLDVIKIAVEKMSFLEIQYFFDILLKKNVVRNMENRILYEWHPDAVNYLSVVTSLKTVAYKLYDPSKRLNNEELTVNLGKPFAPQLSKRPTKTYDQIVEGLEKDFFVEEKMDGERIQVHYENRGEVIKYWSRKATDYTYLYGENKCGGCISPHLQFNDNVVSCVLDGEMVVYDPVKEVLLPFGILKGSAIQQLEQLQGKSEDENTPRPFFMVFDILYLNGQSLTGQKLMKRKDWLSRILTPVPGFVEIIQSQRASTAESVKKALQEAIAKGSEGIILKKSDAKYHIDKRTDHWLKIKPEYLEEFGENVDLLIIGREKSKKDMYYCGLRVTSEDTEEQKTPHFWSFCRIANGFDQSDYRKVDELTRGHWKETSKEAPPPTLLEFGTRLPPEWIDPRHSFVIEVRARSVVKSESGKYRTGTTLYNAFSRKIREDKDWKTAITLDEYVDLRHSRNATSSTDHKLMTKRKRLEYKKKRERRDEEIWNRQNTSFTSNIFESLTFKILADCYHNQNRIEIDDLALIINKNGGQVTKNQFHDIDAPDLRIISDKVTIEANELKNEGFDILRSSWLFDCLSSQKIVNVEPKHCLLVSKYLEDVSSSRVTELGVSYTIPTSIQSLTKVLEKSEVNEDLHSNQDLKKEIELFGGLSVYIVHLDLELSVNYRITKLKLKAFGAKITHDLKDCNYVVVSNTDHDEIYRKVSEVRRKLASMANYSHSEVSTVRVVRDSWVQQSIAANLRLDPQDYALPIKKTH